MGDVRVAGPEDLEVISRLLYDFNAEFDEPTPPAAEMVEYMRGPMAEGETVVLLAGADPVGLAVLRFRPSFYARGLECYLAELYVAPAHRGHGLGRALMDAAIELARERGAVWMDLGTSEDDTAARALYESLGFVNREGGPDGPIMLVYEREL
jgi:ribosomal protein S18 acetylase RimI-like enzyme